MEEFGTLSMDGSEKTNRYPKRWMVGTGGETGNETEFLDYELSSYVLYGNNVMSTQLLEVSVSLRSRNGALSRKGCVANGQMTMASNK